MNIRRIALLFGALVFVLPLVSPANAQVERTIPQRAASRMIVDNDFIGDPDGLLALAHQLLAPRTRVVLVTSSFVSDDFKDPAVTPGRSAAQGREAAIELIRRLRPDVAPPVLTGAERPLATDGQPSPAARAIIAEAMRDDPLPLYFACGGPLTNLAEALRAEPRIATRMTVIWIGGGGYPDGGWEYNLAMDADAARTVIEKSAVPLWQVPQPTYRQMQFSVAEMAADMRPISAFTRWLYSRFTSPPDFIDVAGAWPMGDSPPVLLTALSAESSRSQDRPARRIGHDLKYGEAIAGRTIRVYDTLDVRLIHADFLARLKLHGDGAKR